MAISVRRLTALVAAIVITATVVVAAVAVAATSPARPARTVGRPAAAANTRPGPVEQRVIGDAHLIDAATLG